MSSFVSKFGCCVTLAAMSLGLSVFAQDLDSEFELKERARWVLSEGFEPKILDCRLTDRSDIQCVASENIRSLRCEATHFSKRNEVKASFKGRAFSCEGTRFDKDSLMSQWKVVVRGESGSRSTWIIDAADKPQLERLYETEMHSVHLLEQASRPFWSVSLTGRALQTDEGVTEFIGSKVKWGRDRWRIGGDFYRAKQMTEGQSKNFSRLNGALALGSQQSGQGWVFEVSSGDDVVGLGTRLSSHCLGPEYLLNPGSWRFSAGLGHCWFPSARITFAPFANASAQYRVWGPIFVGAEGFARSLTGKLLGEDVSGLEMRAQLSVSVAVSPR